MYVFVGNMNIFGKCVHIFGTQICQHGLQGLHGRGRRGTVARDARTRVAGNY